MTLEKAKDAVIIKFNAQILMIVQSHKLQCLINNLAQIYNEYSIFESSILSVYFDFIFKSSKK